MRVVLLFLCTFAFCLGSSASHEGIHLLAPKAKQHDLDLESIVPAGPIHSVFSEMHAHLEAGVGKTWFELATESVGAITNAVTGETLKDKVTKIMQVSYAFADILLSDGSIGVRGSMGTLGFSLGISIGFPGRMIPALLGRAIAIANKLLELKYEWTRSILKTMICKFQALKAKLDTMSTSECIPIKNLKFRLIFGGSVSVVGFTPLWEADFPIFEDDTGTAEGALCKMQTCVKDFFTGLKNKLLGGLAKSVANAEGVEGATGFCEASALLETSTSVKGGTKASAGLGFKFMSSPAVTVSLICTTDDNPIKECAPMYATFAGKAVAFAKKVGKGVTISNGDQKLDAVQKARRPMGLPVENAPANNNNCKKITVFRLALGAEVAIGMGVEFSPANTCFVALCQAVKVQMGSMAPENMACAQGGADGMVMGTNNPFLKLETDKGDWSKTADTICAAP